MRWKAFASFVVIDVSSCIALASSSFAPPGQTILTSDQGLVIDKKALTYTARSSVLFLRPTLRLRSDWLQATSSGPRIGQGQLSLVKAQGGVVLANKTLTAYGERAIYHLNTHTGKLEGRPWLENASMLLRAQTALLLLSSHTFETQGRTFVLSKKTSHTKKNESPMNQLHADHISGDTKKKGVIDDKGILDSKGVLNAKGHVVALFGAATLSSHAAQWQKDVASFHGQVRLIKGERKARAESLTVDTKRHTYHLRKGAQEPVILLLPKKQKTP